MSTITEWCPNCELEVELSDTFDVQLCTNLKCQEVLLPCVVCTVRTCLDCPLDVQAALLSRLRPIFME